MKILHGDCLQLMNEIPNGSVDMIFCDLPFGTTKSEWDVVIPFEPLWSHYERIIKPNGAIVLFAKPPFDKMLWSSNPKLYRYDWVWTKNKGTGHLNAWHMPLQSCEYLCVFYKKPPTYNPQMTVGHEAMHAATTRHNSSVYGAGKPTKNRAGSTERMPLQVLDFPVVNNDDPERFHPNQKPVDLCEYIIRTYTNKGEMVLDNCAGSGSTPLACLNTGRKFIAIEQNLEYAEKAQKRIENRQIVLAI